MPQMFRTVRDDKIMEGRDGWYFLSNDTNRVVDQTRGALPLEPPQLRAWQRRFESRTAWLGRKGIPYCVVIPPNPHSLYPEKLPAGVELSEERPAVQIIEHLRRTGSYAPAIYPRDELVAARAERPVASPNDTHWNAWGAFIGYELVLDQIADQVPVRRLARDDVVFTEERRIGDLGAKLDPPLAVDQVVAHVPDAHARVVWDNRVENRGRLARLECPAAPPTHCLWMGDSYTYEILPFVAETFGRTTFAQTSTFDHELVEEIEPDVVVTLIIERFLRMGTGEFGIPTTREQAQAKVAEGKVNAPPLDLLFGQQGQDAGGARDGSADPAL